MTKLLRLYSFSSYQLDLRFAFDAELKDFIKQFPGSYFSQPEENEIGPKRWIVPIECWHWIGAKVNALGYIIEDRRLIGASAPHANSYGAALLNSHQTFSLNPRFLPPQVDAFNEALEPLATIGAWLINLAMRMGKTGVAIELCKSLHLERILVITPAMARREWENEWRFWDEKRLSELFVWEPNLSKSKLALAWEARIHIVSYGQVSSLPKDLHFEAIITDEIHYIQNPTTKQSKAVFQIAKENPKALRLGLTGTVITTHLDSMHAPLDWLWPDRFGTRGSFKFRYLSSTEKYDNRNVKRGLIYGPPREDTKIELKYRLAACSTRRTKLDYPGLFPPLECSLLQPDDVRQGCIELVENLLKNDQGVGILSYERSECAYYAEALDCEALSGEEAAHERALRIASLREKAKLGPVVYSATISATSTGLNMSFVSNFIYTQLSDKIYELVQSFARGHVMKGQPVTIYLMVNPNDNEAKRQAERVMRKVNAIGEIMKMGVEESQLSGSLNLLADKGYTEVEWQDACKLVLSAEFKDGSEVIE